MRILGLSTQPGSQAPASALFGGSKPWQFVCAESPAMLLLPRDAAITQELIAVLVDPKTTAYREVFPFLLTHCRASFQRRIDKLHEALESDDPIPPSSYEWGSLDTEFLPSRRLPVEYHEDPPMLYQSVLRALKQASRNVKLDADDVQHSYNTFETILDLADLLNSGRLLEASKMRISMLRLQRRLRKVIQYGFGITALIPAVKRLFATGEIPFQWVTPPVLPAAISPYSCEELSSSKSVILLSMTGKRLINLGYTVQSLLYLICTRPRGIQEIFNLGWHQWGAARGFVAVVIDGLVGSTENTGPSVNGRLVRQISGNSTKTGACLVLENIEEMMEICLYPWDPYDKNLALISETVIRLNLDAPSPMSYLESDKQMGPVRTKAGLLPVFEICHARTTGAGVVAFSMQPNDHERLLAERLQFLKICQHSRPRRERPSIASISPVFSPSRALDDFKTQPEVKDSASETNEASLPTRHCCDFRMALQTFTKVTPPSLEIFPAHHLAEDTVAAVNSPSSPQMLL
ncbi:hypothetical protein C8J56DRAFT_1167720 [Mycena floridula]|nr:hypothetical protein C8J56DRAFT_1167720 [Mycena floridula]